MGESGTVDKRLAFLESERAVKPAGIYLPSNTHYVMLMQNFFIGYSVCIKSAAMLVL